MQNETLHMEYLELSAKLSRLQGLLTAQLNQLVEAAGLTLGLPIESRVKTWSSIGEKLERKGIQPEKLSDLSDLLGVRITFLFQRDLDAFCASLDDKFLIASKEDTSHRLSDAQFGYQSQHYIVYLPPTWEAVPTFEGLTQYKIEIQIRTLAQHIWAAVSHKLQYKQEESVPLPLRRSIYRASALLETVDLEFTRLLTERDNYVKGQTERASKQAKLDVTVLEIVLNEIFPEANKQDGNEGYSELITDLNHFNIHTRGELTSLLEKRRQKILESDKQEASYRLKKLLNPSMDSNDIQVSETQKHRLEQGVFYTHVGLARTALAKEVGEEAFLEWAIAKRSL
jgi:ppGpp synthetase/RelA/SpoT-type nucleotidyltranferase